MGVPVPPSGIKSMAGGDTGLKKPFIDLRNFSAGGHFLRKCLAKSLHMIKTHINF